METTETKSFEAAAAQALTAAAASQEPATKGSHTSTPSSPHLVAELEHKRAFLATFQRWEMLFKRKDGDATADKWLIAEYFKSLGHLTPHGFDKLTDILKETCIFFPTIRECLEAVTCKDRYDWGHPFRGNPRTLVRHDPPAMRLAAPVQQIGYDGE